MRSPWPQLDHESFCGLGDPDSADVLLWGGKDRRTRQLLFGNREMFEEDLGDPDSESLEWPDAFGTCTEPAQGPDRALHRRRPDGGLARPLALLGAGPLARDDPQRHGRPRRDGLRHEPPYLGRTRAHAQGLSPLRGLAPHGAPDGR